MRFTKWQGCGNDFVLLDAVKNEVNVGEDFSAAFLGIDGRRQKISFSSEEFSATMLMAQVSFGRCFFVHFYCTKMEVLRLFSLLRNWQ